MADQKKGCPVASGNQESAYELQTSTVPYRENTTVRAGIREHTKGHVAVAISCDFTGLLAIVEPIAVCGRPECTHEKTHAEGAV